MRQRHKTAHLQYDKQHLEKPQLLEQSNLADQTQIELYGHNHKRYV